LDAHFIPLPPGEEFRALLADWEAWNYRDDHISLVARAAISHYQFEAIHPFRDGNGRLGRLLAVLLLIERGPLTGHLLSLSPYFEARRDAYGEHLREVSASGDFDPWVQFFATGIAHQARIARTRVERLLLWRQNTVDELRSSGVRGVAITIAEDLIGYPVLTPSEAAKRFGVTYRAANRAVQRLESAGVLDEITGRSYGRKFFAPDVLSILVE
jgi:Fic family protein